MKNLQEQINRMKSMMGLITENETNEGLLDNLKDFFSKEKNYEKLNDPELEPREREKFTCEDCGNPDYKMYMVNDDIWNEYGNDKNTLCMSCLEKRMGRKLTKDDFSDHKNALVNKYNSEVQNI